MNDVTFTIGAEAADARVVEVQLRSRGTRGATGNNVAGPRAIGLYLSSDADGLVPETGDLYVAEGGAGATLPLGGADEGSQFLTDEDGLVEVEVSTGTDAADTVYLNAVLPSGKVVTSDAIAFIDNP